MNTSGSRTDFIDAAIKGSISPGPVYMVKDRSIEASLFKVGAKFTTGKQSAYLDPDLRKENPGPGEYENVNVITRGQNKHVTFARSPRKDDAFVPKHTADIPAVGSYQPLDPNKSKATVAFGKAQRRVGAPKKEEGKEKKTEDDPFWL